MIVTTALKALGGTDIQLHFLEAALDSKSEFHKFLGLNSTRKKCILLIGYLNEMRDDLLRSLKGMQTSFETFLLESSNSVCEQPSKSASLDPPKSLLDDDLGLSNDPCVALEPQKTTDPAITPQMIAEYPLIYAMMLSVETRADNKTVQAEKSDLRLATVTTNTEKPKESFLVTVEEAEKRQPKVVNPVEIPAEKGLPLRQSFFGKTALIANNLGLPSVPQHAPSIPEPTLKTKVAIPN